MELLFYSRRSQIWQGWNANRAMTGISIVCHCVIRLLFLARSTGICYWGFWIRTRMRGPRLYPTGFCDFGSLFLEVTIISQWSWIKDKISGYDEGTIVNLTSLDYSTTSLNSKTLNYGGQIKTKTRMDRHFILAELFQSTWFFILQN